MGRRSRWQKLPFLRRHEGGQRRALPALPRWGRGGCPCRNPPAKHRPAWSPTGPRGFPAQGLPGSQTGPLLIWELQTGQLSQLCSGPQPIQTPPPLPYPAVRSGDGVHLPRAVWALPRPTRNMEQGPREMDRSPDTPDTQGHAGGPGTGRGEKPLPLPASPQLSDKQNGQELRYGPLLLPPNKDV